MNVINVTNSYQSVICLRRLATRTYKSMTSPQNVAVLIDLSRIDNEATLYLYSPRPY